MDKHATKVESAQRRPKFSLIAGLLIAGALLVLIMGRVLAQPGDEPGDERQQLIAELRRELQSASDPATKAFLEAKLRPLELEAEGHAAARSAPRADKPSNPQAAAPEPAGDEPVVKVPVSGIDASGRGNPPFKGKVTGYWTSSVQDDGGFVRVWAGSTAEDPRQGLVVVEVLAIGAARPSEQVAVLTPVREGAVTITSGDAGTLALATDGGSTLLFNVAKREFAQR